MHLEKQGTTGYVIQRFTGKNQCAVDVSFDAFWRCQNALVTQLYELPDWTIFAQVSRRPTTRLKISASRVECLLSTQK